MLLNSEGTTANIYAVKRVAFAGHPTIGTFHTITEADQLFKDRLPSLTQEYSIVIEKNDEGFLFLVTQSEPQWTATDLVVSRNTHKPYRIRRRLAVLVRHLDCPLRPRRKSIRAMRIPLSPVDLLVKVLRRRPPGVPTHGNRHGR